MDLVGTYTSWKLRRTAVEQDDRVSADDGHQRNDENPCQLIKMTRRREGDVI